MRGICRRYCGSVQGVQFPRVEIDVQIDGRLMEFGAGLVKSRSCLPRRCRFPSRPSQSHAQSYFERLADSKCFHSFLPLNFLFASSSYLSSELLCPRSVRAAGQSTNTAARRPKCARARNKSRNVHRRPHPNALHKGTWSFSTSLPPGKAWGAGPRRHWPPHLGDRPRRRRPSLPRVAKGPRRPHLAALRPDTRPWDLAAAATLLTPPRRRYSAATPPPPKPDSALLSAGPRRRHARHLRTDLRRRTKHHDAGLSAPGPVCP